MLSFASAGRGGAARPGDTERGGAESRIFILFRPERAKNAETATGNVKHAKRMLSFSVFIVNND